MIVKYKMEVFPRALYVAIDETSDDIKSFLKGNDGEEVPDIDDNAHAYTLSVTDGKEGGSLIRFRSIKEVTPEIMTHEAVHTVFAFCDYLEIDTSPDANNECFAYMMQWVVRKCLETKELYESRTKD